MTTLDDYNTVLLEEVLTPDPSDHSDYDCDLDSEDELASAGSEDKLEAAGSEDELDAARSEDESPEQPRGESCLSRQNSDNSGAEDSSDRLQRLQRECNKHEKLLLDGIVGNKNIGPSFSDVHVDRSVIENLERLTALALLRPDAFTYGVLRNNRVGGALLYGPSGTGKTLLARALAKQAGVTMLQVSGADVLQEYVGEGEKVARAIFTLARKLHPCIVFIDEADSFLAARKGNDRSWQRSLINQFLREWDSMTAGDGEAAFILLATNRPFDLDTAVLRRVPARFLIDIPTLDGRKAILEILLKDEKLGPKADITTLAGLTTSYTGSDLKNLCVQAALTCVSEEISRAATHKTPARRTIRRRHFDKALLVIKPTTTIPADLTQIRMFDKRSGVC
ncbi:AAA-domain-containing protein [Wilcoxina mikolae CBS 423.85]|nr:AAA-domain-containing protein [Wilcoxina mikolae CBS 423.85]